MSQNRNGAAFFGEEEFRLLYAKIDDLAKAASRGVLAAGDFLTPREQYFAKNYIDRRYRDSFLFYGGYEGAVRRAPIAVPEYVSVMAEYNGGDLRLAAQDELSEHFAVLSVSGSGYKTLDHRDYMGSVLGLGLSRAVIGDILPIGEHRALLVVSEKIAPFLLEELVLIGHDKARTERTTLDFHTVFEQQFLDLSLTVSSMRADCIVAALTGASRDDAQTMIARGLVEVNFSPTEKPSLDLAANDTVSIRGFGRFVLGEIAGETKRGRLRLHARKYH